MVVDKVWRCDGCEKETHVPEGWVKVPHSGLLVVDAKGKDNRFNITTGSYHFCSKECMMVIVDEVFDEIERCGA